MNKTLSLAAILCLGIGLILLPHPALAEDVIYPGKALQPSPLGFANALFPGTTANPGLSGNSVTVNGDVPGFVFGGVSDGADNVTNNRVVINSGTMDWDVYGGWSTNGNATGNNVTLNGGRVIQDVYGGYSDQGNATGNSVTINGGTVDMRVIGGFSDQGNAMYNTVTISGGIVNGDVQGGYSGLGDATYNTVTISGSPTFGVGTTLYGGAGGGDPFTGNTLNVWNYTGSAVNGVDNFQFFNFVLPASLQGLEVTGAVGWIAPGPSTVTGVSIMGGGRVPQIGEKITLIHAAAPGFNWPIANNGAILAGKKGATLDVLFRLELQPPWNDLYAVVEGAQAAPEAKALSEGFLTGLALVNQGADLVAGKGITDATNAAKKSVAKEL